MRNGWSPYLGGALTGLLLVLSVLVTYQLFGHPRYLGTSTAYVRVSGMIEKTISPEAVTRNEYYREEGTGIDWKVMLVLGVPLGVLIAALRNGEFRPRWVPGVWRERFGDSPVVRALGAFVGGFLLIYGARLAGGCPSGHGLSGMSQLAASAFIVVAGFFAGGIPLALILYGRRR
ncbi:YeeE/YedE thiosulfate transporter family protein [Thermosulfurimonas sp. F29]|uniref:YeeE/YedE thiosulfate transporter family protein n=1 Tax=Thermosulfurimonas sp. F29 TaxID=2867247 RepID=UPI001C828DFF|nr:YeeE/YedE thiosulfate transporter family protein [Thermosulfurimonas sp. F29]MBX6422589.1 YeeE/YedE family protein [Thermosulfurimonas sp. F29]